MKRSLPYLVIAIVCIVAFAQVAFLKETLKYDILDGYLPGHYFLSECLRNNTFPLWNPYQQLGFPIYADMLNTNYVVDMFIGRLFPYTNITFHILFIIYVVLAGTGAYRLSRQAGINGDFSLLAGIAYGLSGFITGNALHIQFIIGAAWLPFTVFYFIKFSHNLQFKDNLLFVIFTLLLVTGGYPSFAIMLAYGLIPLFLFYLVRFIRLKETQKAFYYLLHCFAAVVLLIALCAGVFVSLHQAAPYVERYLQLTYDYAVTNPFTPASLISLVSPLVTAAHPGLFQTDVSMNNHYFGILVLILFVYSLTVRINKAGFILLTAALLLLFFSFGEHMFLHRIFFEYVPLFNKFRHPSSFRFITILLILIFTGLQITRHDPTGRENFPVFRRVYLASVTVVAIICLISATVIILRISGPAYFKPEWQSLINDYGIFGPLFIQTALFLIINAVFLYFIVIRQKVSWFYQVATLILVSETVLFTQLNMRYTVTSEYDPLEMRSFLRNSPAGFPLPDELEIGQHTEESAAHVPIINNTNTYAKSVSPYFMYPFALDGFRQLEKDSFLFQKVISNQLLYFENKSEGDTVICLEFGPSRITFMTKSLKPVSAVLLQNNYPGWEVIIDGQKAEHRTVHKSLIGVDLPVGMHEVRFEFRNRSYMIATLISFGLFVVLLLVVQILSIRSSRQINRRYLHTIIVLVILTGIVLILLPVRPFAQTLMQNVNKITRYLDSGHVTDSAIMVFNTESPDPFRDVKGDKIFKRFRFPGDGKTLWDILDTVRTEKLVYIWSNVNEPPEMREIMLMHFPVVSGEYTGERFAVVTFSKDSARRWDKVPYYLNSYEGSAALFTTDGIIYDSTRAHTGRFAEILSGNREFSSTFRKTLHKLPKDGIKVFACVRFILSGTQPFHLVITINRNGKTVHYHAVDLNEFNDQEPDWNTGFTARQFLKSSLRKGDQIVVYCWNSGKNETIFLDDFIVKVE